MINPAEDTTASRKVPVLRTSNSLIHDEFDSIRSRFDEEMRIMEQEMARFKSQMMASLGSKLSTANSSGGSGSSLRSSATSDKSSVAKTSAAAASTSSTQTTKTTTTKTTSLTNKTISKHIEGNLIADNWAQQQRQQQHQQVQQQKEQEATPAPAPAEPMVESKLNSTTTATATTETSSSSSTGQNQNRGCQNENLSQTIVDSPLIVTDNRVAGGKMLKLRFDVSAYEPDQIVVATIDNRLQVYAKRNDVSATKTLFSEYNREFLLPTGTNPDSIKSTLSADGILTIEAPLTATPRTIINSSILTS